jgi:hypothetical protein
MHDLMDRDIRNFVRDNLETDMTFQQLRGRDERCPDFIQETVDTSRGVFSLGISRRTLFLGRTHQCRSNRRFRAEIPRAAYGFGRMLQAHTTYGRRVLPAANCLHVLESPSPSASHNLLVYGPRRPEVRQPSKNRAIVSRKGAIFAPARCKID